MSSRDILEQYLQGATLTKQLTLEEFQDVVIRSATATTYSSETVQNWYNQYLQKDKAIIASMKREVSTFLQHVCQTQIQELESSQNSDSFTLEELINQLYNVNQILSDKLESLNSDIENQTEKLQNCADVIITTSNKTNKSQAITNSLKAIANYISILEKEQG